MNDRELLRMAAKAAGIELVELDECQDVLPDGTEWDPLANDGDALRLAVKLRIKFRYNEALGQGLAWVSGDGFEARANIEDCGRDEYACARLAIVRAAAGIGKAMP